MIGGSQLVTKDVFPYFVFVNGKITRLNYIKLSDNIIKYEIELKKIAEDFYKGNKNINLDNLSENIQNELNIFLIKKL
jgi:acyl-[acyl carrier protein]--UDP-N-acetylglucosamine O-acyltransferase